MLHFTIGLIRICQKKKLMREINMRNLLVSSSKWSYNVNVHWSLYYETLFHIKFPQNLKYWKRFMYALNPKYLEVLKLPYSWKLLCMWLILNYFGEIYWDISIFRAAEARNRLRIMRLRYQANRVGTPVATLYINTCVGKSINNENSFFILF